MRLYHHPMSFNARRAVMTALHLRTQLDLEVVDLGRGEQRKPEYLRMNPCGRVPALDDDGFFLWESHAIMQYLADKTPGQTIFPTEVRARADVNRWLFWSAQHFAPAAGILNWERFVKKLIGAGGPDADAIARGEALVIENARVLDRHLEGREWIVGNALTLADLALAAPLMTTEAAKLPVKDFVHIRNWFGRVQELDAWKRTAPVGG